MLGRKILGQLDGAHRVERAGDQSKALANALIAAAPLPTQSAERRRQQQDVQIRVLVFEQILEGETSTR